MKLLHIASAEGLILRYWNNPVVLQDTADRNALEAVSSACSLKSPTR